MQTSFVDFRAVKAAVSMQMILDRYGINWLRKSGEELRGRCPIHKGEGTDTFHANLSKNAFQCFSCKARGNVLDFVAAMEKCTVRDAAVKLADWFSVSIGDGKNPPASKSAATDTTDSRGEGPAENKPLTFQLKGINPEHPYLAQRGITKETAEAFGLGFFSGRGQMRGRVVIPIHKGKGELVAYAGRSIDKAEPKYKLPAGFHKSLELYNLHRAAVAKDSTTVVLVEGFFDCIKMHTAGYPCVALMGSSLSEEQEALLSSHFTGAVLLLDGDEAGRKGTDDCLLRLGRRMWVKAAAVPEGKQPDMLTTEEIWALVEA
jgi:DNA primase